MSVVVPARAVELVSKAKDPKQAIFDSVASHLHGIDIIGDMVLVGTYIRPEKTAGGIIRPETNKQEDVWQGKVGVVLKWGPDAFRNEEGEVYEQAAGVGEWVVFKVGDGWSFNLNGYPCRLVRDANIRMIVKNPDVIL